MIGKRWNWPEQAAVLSRVAPLIFLPLQAQ